MGVNITLIITVMTKGLGHKNPFEMNLQGNIEKRTIDKSTGQNVETWAAEYSNVFMKRLNPPRGREVQEGMQPVALQTDSFMIVDENRSPAITAADFRISLGGEYYYITGVRPFQSGLIYLILDTEKRDNE